MDYSANCAVMQLPQQVELIRSVSALSSGLLTSPVSRWFRRLTVLYEIPRLIGFIEQLLSNDFLERMPREEAVKLYVPLYTIHRGLSAEVDKVARRRILSRTLFRPWMNSMRASLERIGDIVEALAWVADEDLRTELDRAVSVIEQHEFHLS